jgi:hypothetical protein
MARDPNGIALQSVDNDLSVDDQNPAMQGGFDQLADYADAVTEWGEEIVEEMGRGGAVASRFTSNPLRQPSFYHPQNRLNTPFVVAGLLTLVILILVFVPKR